MNMHYKVWSEYVERVGYMEPVRIGLDEVYVVWYKCPLCEYEYIKDEDNFCGGCGVPITWKEE